MLRKIIVILAKLIRSVLILGLAGVISVLITKFVGTTLLPFLIEIFLNP
jgi:hypothetical protein